uniref:Uncharacterized protein n=1 Tax=Parascaris univalens TaxID=6257 RepID=A0A915BPD3_PARUN
MLNTQEIPYQKPSISNACINKSIHRDIRSIVGQIRHSFLWF